MAASRRVVIILVLTTFGVAYAQTSTTQPAENIAAVRALIKSKNAEDRWRGVNMLAEAKSPEAAGLLISEVDDNVYAGNAASGWDTTGERAIKLLGKRRDAAAVEALIRIVQRGPVPFKNSLSGFIDHSAIAAQSLGLIGDRRAVPVLVLTVSTRVQKQIAAALKPDYQPRTDLVILSGVEALGRLGDARALPPLMKIVSATYSHLGGPVNAPPHAIVSYTFKQEQITAAFDALAKLPGADVNKALADYIAHPPAVTESTFNAAEEADAALAIQQDRFAAVPATQP